MQSGTFVDFIELLVRYLPAKVWRGFVRKLLVALHDLGWFLGTGDNDEIPASSADLDGQNENLGYPNLRVP